MSHIFLYGPSGTGKSTIGEKLARNLKLRFVDLDRAIETNAGMSIAQIMEQQGETAFRDLETTALKATVGHAVEVHIGDSMKSQVIALGGGALLRDENRALVETSGNVILLIAELSTLLERMQNESDKRPLLAGDLKPKLISLLEKRKEHYNSFPVQVRVDNKTPEQNVHQIQVALGRHHLSAMGEYDVIVGQVGSLTNFPMQNPIVVTDENVARFHGETVLSSLRRSGFAPKMITVPAGEGHKNLETIQKLWYGFLEHGLDRRSTVIALGGGVIGDMAGFAASTYMRGIDWIAIPTTLLSMVDASLGGKTGFDLPEGKNLIGSFYPPKLVLADPQLLKTLPEAELISGIAEVVKHGIIADPELFDLCARGLDCIKAELAHVVKRAMAVKIKIIEDDPYEKGFRAALNLGHTVGHAVELVSRFELRHGEAVAIGMVSEAKLAEQLNLASKGLSDRISHVLTALGLPVQIPANLPREEVLRAMRVDKKKNAASIRFALPVEVGEVELVDVTDLELVLE
jgi:shikimate kinase / 3-dehydroquinate synthase